ncbi:hypothetical protein M8369_26790, partial [Klebsiella pneumoniae]|nr:hypothetical protein [Klebsiella pneumoniae]
MKFIIKLFPEITIKSQSVRLRFIKILTGNIRNVLKNYDETLAVVHFFKDFADYWLKVNRHKANAV